MKEQNDRGRAKGRRRPHITLYKQNIAFTFTFKALFVETPQQTATVFTEGGALVVIVLEAMRHINLEALFLELQTHRNPLNPQKAAI